MKFLRFTSGDNGIKQVVVVAMTTQVIHTNREGKAVCSNIKTANAKPWRYFDASDFSIQYPKSWTIDTSRRLGLRFILLAKASSQENQFRENLNLLIQDLKGTNVNLDKFVEISENQVKTMITNGKILESQRMREDGQEYHKMMYSGNSGYFKFKFLQYYWVKNEKAYVLTLTAETNKFDKYVSTAELIMKSFRVK